ncbi:MAG: hypothetical protein Q8P81_03790 [Nanoarchaeota archaeon]|nr:hypothetical protein [Nanoarchaeota archaeon]
MKKAIVGIVLASVLFLVAGLFASAQTNSMEMNSTSTDSNISLDNLDSTDANSMNPTSDSDDLSKKFDESISQEAYNYIYNFIKKMNINEGDVVSISMMDFNNLPSSVNFGSISKDSNLAVYEVAFRKDDGLERVYVVSYSLDKVESQEDVFPLSKSQLLNFGISGRVAGSGFLKTSTGVETSLQKGYVMVRDGSITAMSTNLEVLKEKEGLVEVIIYINGEPVGFGNLLSSESVGAQNDYDTLSERTASFNAGDVISVYVKSDGGLISDMTTLVEITTN